MCRLMNLVSLIDKMKQYKIGLILVQINEAHTTKWPLGMNDHPEPQQSFDDRVKRANEFNTTYPYFNVYVDSWSNTFENTFQAWPDQYYLIDNNKKVRNRY
jgi:hypothetical protein